MPNELPYLSSYKNLPTLFARIEGAKRPDSFTNAFLGDTLGLKSTTDRPLIAFLKTLGFLDATSRPTAEYALLKNSQTRRETIARAVRRAYAPLFDANENAHALPNDALKGLIAQVAGTDEGMTQRIAYTFNAVAKLGDFAAVLTPAGAGDTEEAPATDKDLASPQSAPAGISARPLRPEFHYNIQIHLPSNGSEETYLSIFNALRKVFR